MKSNFKNFFFVLISITFINCGSNSLFMKKDISFSENFDNQKTFENNWIDNS